MKFFTNASCLLALATSVAIAAPAPGPYTAAPANAADIEGFYQEAMTANRRDAQDAAPGLSQVLTAIEKALPKGISNQLQAAVAELFKAGDAILNLPLDAIEGGLKLDGQKALGGSILNILKTLGSLPKDAGKILGVGQKPASTTAAAAPTPKV
ncbi:hypothetical protein LMH87_009967 [Akanthomyces muscarius]|uniref:Cell wall protein n=1 Tax=Akanthomyces muscarius TaxID=2231603 RepID=A0A9W8QD17_AKAMU|nr:hypothetical protein LMH87_009967 [Akanthomyces muscarius]KAJ4153482.1 hypothetical protein LMH87_009967 [Akanthomyces muscarius]